MPFERELSCPFSLVDLAMNRTFLHYNPGSKDWLCCISGEWIQVWLGNKHDMTLNAFSFF